MTLDIRQLTAFLAIVQSGSLGRGADALHVTQPALSRTVRQLEDKLGAPLFERYSTGMVLTDYGRTLLPHARLLKEEADLAVEEINALRGLSKGTVRVGAVASVLSAALPDAIEHLLGRWPGLHVQITEGVEDVLSEALVRNEIDLAIAVSIRETEEISMVADAGWQDTSCLVASRRHAIWDKPVLAFADLQECQWVMPPRGAKPREELHQLFAEQGLGPPNVVVETRSVITIKALVQHARFLSSLPLPIYKAESESGDIRALPLPQARATRHFYVFRRRRGSLPRPAEQLLQALRQVTAQP